ncbi:hypothetical protein [Streptomyces sp. WAC 01325]|nr:hypothetical protein [Streptomyces sp. WAC 01325]
MLGGQYGIAPRRGPGRTETRVLFGPFLLTGALAGVLLGSHLT